MKRSLMVILVVLMLWLVMACPTPNSPSLSSEKELTAFSFLAADNAALSEDVTGSISGTAISATVPYGTDVTALVATFETTGVSVEVGSTAQSSGETANDFTSPVVYTVTAEDDGTSEYTVTVSIAAPPAEESSIFSTATSIGEQGTVTLNVSGSSQDYIMVYANNHSTITYPTGLDDSSSATLSTRFWMGETEVVNSVVAEVLQWAYDNGKFSTNSADPNYLGTDYLWYGGQKLIDFGYANVAYDGAGAFSVVSGFEQHPADHISWYGAIMVCNWLTEMRDQGTANLVYTGIDTDWALFAEDPTKNGYRLPSAEEWGYAARYLGTTAPSTGGNLDTDRVFQAENYTGSETLTAGYYWMPGDYASAAYTFWNDLADLNSNGVPDNKDANDLVAVYNKYVNGFDTYPTFGVKGTTDNSPVKSLNGNTLGLYDMSGNAGEWSSTQSVSEAEGTFSHVLGGDWFNTSYSLQVGNVIYSYPNTMTASTSVGYVGYGFRLCRTAD